ncbi:hypothetical protein PACTADRAFT_829 [Pachysolen tannophilus NRRL Y-2460]|uniref:TEL2-interacting protein 1 n=1 Tax=Pachysolen tannophilus NRRL Y-2460 TaxID=669874 RepID=A0A1E4U2Y0_PACTA|nr:hypothetical protein PACTADRAFT_829 [Pachysolen tannophilus NRRL Y-2460]
MTNEDDRLVFRSIKPYCIALSQVAFLPPEVFEKTPSNRITNLLNDLFIHLSDIIREVDLQNKERAVELSPNLADYVFVPIAQLLKQPNLKDRQLELVLKIINILIERCWFGQGKLSKSLLQQLLPLIIFLIDSSKNDKVEVSNELRLAGLNCISSLLNSLLLQDFEFFTKKNLQLLANMITLLLDFTLIQNNVLLQTKSLEILSILYFQVINDGEILSYILPGNVSTMVKLIAQKNGLKTHYSVLILVLNLLGDLLSLVFNDKQLGVIDTKSEISSINDVVKLATEITTRQKEHELNPMDLIETNTRIVIPENTDIGKQQQQQHHRTNSWLKASKSQIKLSFPIFASLKNHNRAEVRLSLLNFLEKIIKNCSKSLDNCLPIVIDILSFLNNEESLKQKVEIILMENKELVEFFIKKLDSKIDLLPAVISSPNQEKISIEIESLKFFLYNLPTNNNNNFLIEKLCESLNQSLTNYFKFQINSKNFTQKNAKTLVDITSSSIGTDFALVSSNYDNPEKNEIESDLSIFENFYGSDVENSLINLFKEIGRKPEFSNFIVNHLLSMHNENVSSNVDDITVLLERSVSLWIVNGIIQGFIESSNLVQNEDVISEFLIIEDGSGDQSSNTQDFRNTTFKVLEYANELLDQTSASHHDLVISLIQSISLDSIALSSSVLKEEFKTELIDYLYPVIDSLASRNDKIRLHAQNAALVIAKNCYDSSMYHLIQENCDYLIDSLSIKLTSDFITPRTSNVLLVLVKIGGIDLITQLTDIINNMFSLIDLYHGYSSICEGFFVVFDCIAEEIERSLLQNYDIEKLERENTTTFKKPWGLSSVDGIIDLFDDSKRKLEINLDDKEIPLVKNPGVPFGEAVDSDDDDEVEDDEEESAVMEAGGNKEESQKWDSPVPKFLYFLVQKILLYGDRLMLSSDSMFLKQRILMNFQKILKILATSPDNFYPILSDLWPIILHLCNDDEVRIISPSMETASLMFKYGGEFMNKRFTELWYSINKDNKIFKKYSKLISYHNRSEEKKNSTAVLIQESLSYNADFKCYKQIIEVLILGLNKYNDFLPSDVISSIINCSILLYDDVDQYGKNIDIAWWIKFKHAQSNQEKLQVIGRDVPEQIQINNGMSSFQFYSPEL